ncbi:MAG: hypothetical protein PHH58_05270 [Rhodoferax sp.]|nr:hypothetical protein [Rhodoferax sp.]
MSRLIRNTVILLKAETVYGTDPVPVGTTDALLVSNLSINPFNAKYVDRKLVRSYLGASDKLVGAKYVEMGFDLELAGAGTVATAPPWAPSLLACAMAQTLTATVRADYTPVSTGFGSCTIYWYDDGLLHKATGVRGNPVFKMAVGDKPVISYKFMGAYSTPTVVSNPATTLTAWKTPQIITEANTLDLTFGGTHATATAPLIVGGTTYPSQGIEVDLGHKVDFNDLLGGQTFDISERSASGKVTLDLTPTQEAAFMQMVDSGTLQSVGLSHGTITNQKVLLWLPNVQLSNPQKVDSNGKRLVGFDLTCLPSAAGNDEVRLVTSF